MDIQEDVIEKIIKIQKLNIIILPKAIDNNIIDNDLLPNFSDKIVEYPRISLGYTNMIEILKKKYGKLLEEHMNKNPYNVLLFEPNQKSTTTNLYELTNKFFKLEKNKPKILSRAFFKLWEIINLFDLIPLNMSNFVSAHLAERQVSLYKQQYFLGIYILKKNIQQIMINIMQ